MNQNLSTDYRRYGHYFVNLQNLSRRKDIVVYTGLTLSLFAIAFFSLFALKPTFITIASLYKETQEKKELEQELQTKINNLKQAQSNYAQVASSVYLVNQALPPYPSLSDLIYQMEALAQKSNLAVNSANFSAVNFQDSKGEGAAGKIVPETFEISFTLTVKGSYENLKAFIERLEKLRRVLIIESFSFGRRKTEEKTEDAQALVLNLNLKAFYLSKK